MDENIFTNEKIFEKYKDPITSQPKHLVLSFDKVAKNLSSFLSLPRFGEDYKLDSTEK